ncbi:hypothetical protein [Gordonia alkanivorans]|uniref:hypothetical protein n=1 Tax=Gordonia alkanivorans TaxID=84096 RepID=UPI001F4E2371|nr:hypothetical protein [Gordonia alkanivorans]
MSDQSAQTPSLRNLPRTAIISGVVASLAVVAIAVKTGYPLRYDDERQYLDIAHSVSSGGGFALDGAASAWRPPAWPLILAYPLAMGVPEPLLLAVPAILIIGAAVIAASIAVRLTGNLWGAVAGVAVLAYPLNLYTASTLYPQALATLLIVALFYFAVRVSDMPPGITAVGAGLLASVVALSVPTLAFTGAVVVAWIAFQMRSRFGPAFLTVAAFLTPIAGWAIRNWIVLGSPVLLSTSTGSNLLIGNNPTARASTGVSVDISVHNDAVRGMSELDSDGYLRDRALEWITENPVDAGWLFIRKTLNYFSPYNSPATSGQGDGTVALVAWVAFFVVVALVAVRIVKRADIPFVGGERLVFALYVINAPVMAIFFTRARFRQPLDSMLLIEATVGLVLLGIALSRRTKTDPANSPDLGVTKARRVRPPIAPRLCRRSRNQIV